MDFFWDDFFDMGMTIIISINYFVGPLFFGGCLEVPSDSPSVMAVWDPWHRQERARGRARGRVLRRATTAVAVAGGVAMVSNGEVSGQRGSGGEKLGILL